MKKWLSGVVAPVFLTALVLGSCDSFFSESWGKERDYKASNITVTGDNVDSWLNLAAGNPNLAKALAEAIKNKVNAGGISTTEKAKLQEAGVSLAVEASGLGALIISNAANSLTNLTDNSEEAGSVVEKLLNSILDNFKPESSGAEAAKNLAGILESSVQSTTNGANPKLDGAYADNAKSSDVAEAVLLLSLAVIGEKANGRPIENIGDWVTDFNLGLTVSDSKVKVDITKGTATREALTLAAYLNLIAGNDKFKDDPITGKLHQAFGL